MQTSTQTPATGFLASLFPLTRYDEVEVTINVGADKQLDVEIRVSDHAMMTARGTPAALEKALPAAVAKYAAWVETQEAGEDTEAKITLPGEKPAARPKPARKKAAKAKRAPARKAAARKPAPRRAPPTKRTTTPASDGKPGKAECISDYREMKAKHGAQLTRRLFVDKSRTGRRYEKLWGTNWPAFVKEAERGMPESGEPAAPAAATRKPRKVKKAAPPAPTPAPKPDKPAVNQNRPWDVMHGRKKVGATIFEKKVGDVATFSGGKFTVLSVDAAKREIQVEPAGAAAPPASPPPPPADEKPAADAPAPATTDTETV